MPPLVPATVKAGVVVGFATEIKPPVKLILETVPVPLPPPPIPDALAVAPLAPYPRIVPTPVPLELLVMTRTYAP
jgi:hypothetical protein